MPSMISESGQRYSSAGTPTGALTAPGGAASARGRLR